jgi:TnpA family transposase
VARRRLLSDEAWDAVMALPSDERDLVRHYTLSSEDLDRLRGLRATHNQLGQALLLCAMRHPGRTLAPGERLPEEMIAWVARQLDLDATVLAQWSNRAQTRREQIGEIARAHGFTAFGRDEAAVMTRWLTPTAQIERRPQRLIEIMLAELRRRGILLPQPRVLELVVHRARAAAARVTWRALAGDFTADQDAALETLFQAAPDQEGLSRLAWLRQFPATPSARSVRALIERLGVVRALGMDRRREHAVPPGAFDAIAMDGMFMTAQHLRELAPPRRRATLAAGALRLETELTDATLMMFDRLLGRVARKAERATADGAATALKGAQTHLRTLARAGRAVIAAHDSDGDIHDAVDQAVGWARFLSAVAETEGLAASDRIDMRAELVRRWSSLRLFAPDVLRSFSFEGARSASGLLRAVTMLREAYAGRGAKRKIPGDAPTGFIRKGWRPFVIGADKALDVHAWEVCVLFELRDRLRAGDVWVAGSRRFRSFEATLLPPASFAALRDEGPLPVGVPEDPRQWLDAQRDVLAKTMIDVAAGGVAGTLEDVAIENGVLKIGSLKADSPDEAQALGAAAYDLLPRIKITDLLLEVDDWTGFTSAFTHQRSGMPAEDRTVLLTAILADGVNLGLTRMAEAVRGPSLRELAWAHDWHVREECYANALARIIDTHRALPLARLWGDGSTSSSDGQFFRAGGRGEPWGDINARHGSEPGVAFYTHISDQFGPFHTKVIAATASEAPHVLDGLLAHRSGLRIAEHFTDTGGATDHVFGMLALLGLGFAPRLRDIRDRRLHLPPGMEVPPALSSLVGDSVKVDRIEKHWEDLLRLAVSVGAGHVSASETLQRLAAYPRQNSLALALREVGRLQRSAFMLDWLRDPELRRRAGAGLNKGEARNALARAVFFHRLGELRDRTFENQIYRASGLNLLVAAIILWNTRYLQVAFAELERQRRSARPDIVRHVAPLGWEHISLTGDYIWPAAIVGPLRPLREKPSMLAA